MTSATRSHVVMPQDPNAVRHYPLQRTLDLTISAAGTLLLAIVWAPIAVAIRLDSRGPAMFRQTRLGFRGRTFRILKFRTMVVGSESDDWTAADDPRITRVGRLLRRCHLDELPQMINVLRGEMSVVGPRPERPEIHARLLALDPGHADRLLVRPGITGLGAISNGYAGTTEQALARLRLDRQYMRSRALATDLHILGRTVAQALGGRGR